MPKNNVVPLRQQQVAPTANDNADQPLLGFTLIFQPDDPALGKLLSRPITPSAMMEVHGIVTVSYCFHGDDDPNAIDEIRQAMQPSGDDQYELINTIPKSVQSEARKRLHKAAEFEAAMFSGPDDDGSGLRADEETVTTLNDAECNGDIALEILEAKITISTARKCEGKSIKGTKESMFDQSGEIAFKDFLLTHLTKIRRGGKNGTCFVPGSLKEGRRNVNAVTDLHMLVLDVDSGAWMDATIAIAKSHGLFFIAYTTHSHQTTHVEYKKDRYYKWAEANGHEPDLDSVSRDEASRLIRLFMTAEDKYVADVVASAEFVKISHEKTGIMIFVKTRPIDKFRLVFVLDKPFVIAKFKGPQRAAQKFWGDIILGMGAVLGIKVDRACRDVSRLYYLPSGDEGAENARIIVNAGRDGRSELATRTGALDMTKITPVSIADYGKAASSDAFDVAGSKMGGKDGSRPTSPQRDIDMMSWARETAHGFQISSVFKDHCDDRLRDETAPGKFTVECPFDDDHSNAGDPDDKGCFIMDAGMDAETFSFRCSHDSCADRDRLKMLEKAMNDGWFTDDVLTDKAYDVSGVDDEAEEDRPVSEDDADDARSSDPATRFLGLNALIKNATAEKAADGSATAATMEALMDCVARQKSRLPIYERIKASKIVSGLGDFKKEVEDRAKAFARAAEIKQRAKDAAGQPGKDRHFRNIVDGILAMNEEIALVQRGSGVVFYEKRETDEPWLSLEAAPVVYRPWSYGDDFEPLFPAWVASSHRDHRTEIVFKPYVHGTSDLTPANHLNLYRGLALEPVEGDCMDYYRHIFHIVCGGNMRFFKYVVTWLAQMMQEPDMKPGTALVLRGLKGIGKGIFVDALRPILGRHSVKVSDPKQLTGNFNGHMDAKILAIAEEAFFGGDRKVDSIVKDMITSDRMMLERKFMDAAEIDDYRRFIFLSNAENVVRATPDERRYAVTLVIPEQKHNRAYWDHFGARIASGDLPAALAYDLLRLDRDRIGVDLRTPPRTAALMDQILTNQSAEDQWLRGVLTGGAFLDANGATLGTPKLYDLWKTQPVTIGKDTVYESYRAEVGTYYGKEVSAEKIGKYLLGMFKETEDGESLVGVEGNGVTGRSYVLPPLPELRSYYEDHHLPLNHRAVDNDAEFIRVTKPKIAMFPEKPQSVDEDDLKLYEAKREVFNKERAEVRAEADEFIRQTLGPARQAE